MTTPQRIWTYALQALLCAAGLLVAAPAFADTHAQAGLAWAGQRLALSGGDFSAALVATAAIDGEHLWRRESIMENSDQPPAPPWGLRGDLRADGLLLPDHVRGRMQGRTDADLGYFLLSARLSYGKTASFTDRYWRSGRDLVEPGLGLGGRGWVWQHGPTDIRVLSWLAEVEVPVETDARPGDVPWNERVRLDLGGNIGPIAFHRIRNDRHLSLDIFRTTVWRYASAKLLDIAIDVLSFRSRPLQQGWSGQAAIGMSALRLNPAPHEADEPSPGQATPAARLGLGYQGAITSEVVLATFHRIDPSGAAIDRGGSGQISLLVPMGSRWSFAGITNLIFARRVRVGSALSPDADQFHDWLVLRYRSARLSFAFGSGWQISLLAWAESSDRDNALLFPSAPTRMQQSLGAQLGLSWALPSPSTNGL
jgi:hypothetical protein